MGKNDVGLQKKFVDADGELLEHGDDAMYIDNTRTGRVGYVEIINNKLYVTGIGTDNFRFRVQDFGRVVKLG